MNIELGKMNRLRVVKAVDFGMYLDGGDAGEILLPARYVPEGCSVGDELDVFLYLDSEERLVATTQTPLAQVGDFAYLQVAWVNNYGAFLDWGLMKDLFVPFREQKLKMQKGRSYIVHLHVDEESYRLMASAKVERYLSDEMPPYREGDEVQILVRVQAYIKQVRPDGKLDITLQKQGREAVDDFSQVLLEHLQHNAGRTPLCDKSPAEEIYAMFGVSKKVFKKAVGDLYKKRLIEITDEGLRLV